MTIREIADTAGVSTDTVTRKAKELFPTIFEKGKITRLSQAQSIEVMKVIRKVNFVELPQTREAPTQLAEAGGLSQRDIDLISAIVSRTVAMTIQQLDLRLSKIEERVEERQALLPAPKVSDRDSIREIVNKEAVRSRREQGKVWNELYDRCYYLHMGNLKLQATNAKAKSVLDHIDKVGLSSEVLAVALDLWGIRG